MSIPIASAGLIVAIVVGVLVLLVLIVVLVQLPELRRYMKIRAM